MDNLEITDVLYEELEPYCDFDGDTSEDITEDITDFKIKNGKDYFLFNNKLYQSYDDAVNAYETNVIAMRAVYDPDYKTDINKNIKKITCEESQNFRQNILTIEELKNIKSSINIDIIRIIPSRTEFIYKGISYNKYNKAFEVAFRDGIANKIKLNQENRIK